MTAFAGQGQGSPSPARLDPDQQGERLVACEHLARYVWAAQLAAGREVLDAGCGVGYGAEILAEAGAGHVVGVDLDPIAVQQTAERGGERVDAERGDLIELPFASGSFDLVVCFEVIEHVEDQERALEELHRVLRQDGVLVISSPNRDEYPPGNPHHSHEFTVGEFSRLLRAEFSTVELSVQRPWLGSILTPLRSASQLGTVTTYHRFTDELAPDVFVLAVASDGAPAPGLVPVAVLGEPFELRWWHDTLAEAQSENERLTSTVARHRETEQRIAALSTALEDAERSNVRIAELERHLEECERIVRSYETSLLGRIGRVIFELRGRRR